MSDPPDTLDIREQKQLARIDRAIPETRNFTAEQNKLVDEA